MLPYMDENYGNPSSLHTAGQRANEALCSARERIAACLGCTSKEITFTSGGSEADNQAIVSAARMGEKQNKKHIVSSAFEHHAVLHTLDRLKREGFEITLLPADIQRITALADGDEIKLISTPNGNYFTSLRFDYMCFCLQGAFPDCEAMQEKYRELKRVSVNKQELLAALNRCFRLVKESVRRYPPHSEYFDEEPPSRPEQKEHEAYFL